MLGKKFMIWSKNVFGVKQSILNHLSLDTLDWKALDVYSFRSWIYDQRIPKSLMERPIKYSKLAKMKSILPKA